MSETDKHLCDLAEEKNIDKMKSLAKDANWICSACGRVSNVKDRLCEPVDLM